MNEKDFESNIIKALEDKGFDIVNLHPSAIDIIAEKENKKVAIEVKHADGLGLKLMISKAFGQIMAAKVLHKADEYWIIVNDYLSNSDYIKVIKENGIRIFVFKDNDFIEQNKFEPNHKNRQVRKGMDVKKFTAIWKVLEEAGDWLHINEIARRSGVNEVTVRYYINNYFTNAIKDQRINDKIKLRLIKLKDNVSIDSHLRFLKVMTSIKGRNIKKGTNVLNQSIVNQSVEMGKGL